MSSLTEQLQELASTLVLADPDSQTSFEGLAARIANLSREAAGAPNSLSTALAELERHALGLESDDAPTRAAALRGASAALDALLAAHEPGRHPEGFHADEAKAPAPTSSAPSAEDAQLVLEFITEAQEHLAGAEAGLLALESDPGNSDHLNAVFRSFHTIKGVAGFLDLTEIGALAHSAENLLDLARQKRVAFFGARVDVTLESLDVLRELIAELSDAMKNGRGTQAHTRLPALLARLKKLAVEDVPATEPVNALDGVNLNTLGAPLPAPAPRAPSATHVATAPAAVEANPGFTLLNTAPLASSAAGPSASATPGQSDASKVAQETRDSTVSASSASAGSPASSAAASSAATAAGGPTGNSAGDGTVKVATSRLDSLINMVGELLTARLMVQQEAASLASTRPKLVKNIQHLAKISRELQDLSMSMRMVPIHAVFQKMGRIVRDVARKAGKEVEFDFVGGETELDRNLVEAIADPLVHMIRNAADHGIEPPEERVAAGKTRAGRIELRAFHLAGNVVIQIIDDGRGLNRSRILKKAVDAGLVQNPSELTDTQVWALIFHAGLSTAEKVTDLSGRGVGMDVVKRNVEALRGRVDIESTPGKGSVFTIRLPLTLAMIDAMVVKVGSSRYILPMSSIERSIRPRAEQISTVRGKAEMCLVRGDLLPMFRLHRLFNVEPTHLDPTEALGIIVQAGDRRCCVIVDELLGIQQVIIKSLGEDIAPIQGICGGAILGDGCVSLIVDVPGLIDIATRNPESTHPTPHRSLA
jgi:two-component system, chemotaxis family, sensor kinase CheA